MGIDNNIIEQLVRGELVKIVENPKQVYDLINYYEMNLYVDTDVEDIKIKINELNNINHINIAKFKEEIKLINEQLEVKGIKYCILAGIPLTERYHLNKNRRLQEDIDFFVSQKDMKYVDEIMDSLGYYVWNNNVKKKHITYIKQGKTGNDLSKDGRCAVKFYRRMTDKQFLDISFENVSDYIEEYNEYKVFKPEMALLHLILHAHYYDMHPKILCDIYAICNSGLVNYNILYNLIKKYKIERVSAIVFGVLVRFGLDGYKDLNYTCSSNIDFICDVLSSKTFWEKIFVRLDKNDMTLLRCFIFDDTKYRSIYNDILENGMERRVSPMRNEFFYVNS